MNYEISKFIKLGCFYNFYYDTTSKSYDREPLVFVLRYAGKNNFEGINLHHYPLKVRIELLKYLQKYNKDMFNNDCVELKYGDIKLPTRIYNKEKMYECKRIFTNHIVEYITKDGYLNEVRPDDNILKMLNIRKESNLA